MSRSALESRDEPYGQSGEPKPPFKIRDVGTNPETLDIEGPAKQALKPGGTESGAPAVSCIVPKIDRFCNQKLPRVGEAFETGRPRTLQILK